MGKHRNRVLGGLVATSLASVAAADCAPDKIDFRTELGVASFSAEIADDEAERSQGLMHRETMDPDHGMLFVFDRIAPVTFWMKNTPMSLDIIFINRRGVICSIAAGTTPYSTAQIPSGCAVQTVFEVRAGQAAVKGLKVGSPARHEVITAPVWACE